MSVAGSARVDPRPSPLEGAPHGFDLSTSTIMVVDDEEAIVVVLRQMLKTAGFLSVVGTTNASRAREIFQEIQPDLVLLDLRLPDVDGYELLADLRGTEGSVPVIVLTADTTNEAKRRCLEAGASDFLTKPFDRVEVVLRIRNLLELQRLQLVTRDHAAGLERLVAERTAELTRSLEDLRRADGQRRHLLGRLVDAQEHERQRLAADIHDDPIQKMTALAIRLETLQRRIDDPSVRDAIAQSLETINATISRLRSLLFLLRPPTLDESGLVPAISELVERVGRDIGVRHWVRDELTAEPPAPLRSAAYRIAQEAITNVGKHAKATTVTVSLHSRDGGIYVRVEDDGVGPPSELGPEHGYFGLQSMQERAQLVGGWWRFGPGEAGGTAVEYWLPINGVEAAS
jgi:signal transduction histidine kinase